MSDVTGLTPEQIARHVTHIEQRCVSAGAEGRILAAEIERLTAENTRLTNRLTYQNRVEWQKRAGALAMVIWHVTAVTVRAITVSACDDRGCDHPACEVLRECRYARDCVREYELQDVAAAQEAPSE